MQQFGRSIRRTALGFSRRYDDIVIDVAGGDEVAIATSLRIAQQAIVPFQPNELDIWTSGYLEDMIEPAMALNDELRVHAVLKPCSHSQKQVLTRRERWRRSRLLRSYTCRMSSSESDPRSADACRRGSS